MCWYDIIDADGNATGEKIFALNPATREANTPAGCTTREVPTELPPLDQEE